MQEMYIRNSAPRHEDVWGIGGIAPPFLTSALDGDELSASFFSRFTPVEGVTGTHWIGGWVVPRAGLDVMEKRIEPRPSSPDPVTVPGSWRSIYSYTYIKPKIITINRVPPPT
jgi:hypothetical protein